MVLLILVVQILAPTTSAEPTMSEHYLVIIQGDDPQTEPIEPENELHFLERFFVSIPWNESWVKVPVPKGVKPDSWDIDNVIQIVYPDFTRRYEWGQYSAFWSPSNPPTKYFDDMEDMDCCLTNYIVWGFPRGADRNQTESTVIDTDYEFIYYFEDVSSDNVWNFSNKGLRLKSENASGNYTSIPITMGVDIIDIQMDWNISSHDENVSFFVSNNNGVDWLNITEHKGEKINFTSQGNELVWKINMTQETGQNNSPVLTHVWINVTNTPEYNDIILQLNYVFEENLETNTFEFVMDFSLDYNNIVNPHTLIYLNDDYSVRSTGIKFTKSNFTQPEYPDKDVYYFMFGSFSPESSITITRNEPTEESFPWSNIFSEENFPWFLMVLLIIIALIITIFLLARSRKKDVEEEPSEVSTEEFDEEIAQLMHKKEGLLKAIKKLDSDHEEGLLDEDVYKDMRKDYMNKTAEVMKEMDALTATAAAVAASTASPSPETPPEISEEKAALIEKKEKILKSIKKLDKDFEEGTLDEDVYNELRDGYKKKAAEILSELDELE
jgi:hypothetical protein